MKTELSSPCVSMYGRNLNKIRSFYHSFDESDKKIVIYIVSKLTEARRQSLKQIYGSNLDKVHTPNEIVKIDRRVISALNDLFRIINTKLNKIKINGIPKEELNTVENKSSRLNGIYQFFSFISVEMVDASLNNLFNEELCILKKVFGDKLTDNNYYDNKEKLSEIELAIYNSIMNKLQKQLMFQKQSNKKNAKAAFYQFFYNLGYTKESVELVLSCNNIKSLVAEYLNQEVSFARKEKILEIIYKVLCKEFGQPFNYSRFKERVKQVQSPS